MVSARVGLIAGILALGTVGTGVKAADSSASPRPVAAVGHGLPGRPSLAPGQAQAQAQAQAQNSNVLTAAGPAVHPQPTAGPAATKPAAPAPTPRSTPPPAPTPPPSTPSLKPLITGVISKVGPPPSQYLSTVRSFVVGAYWSDLQTQPGGPLTTNNEIDKAIAIARQQGLNVKVRIFAGINAPNWAKSIDGPPVTVHDPVDNVTGTIGRFWTPDYGRAYQDLIAKIAARYDNVPQIQEVVAARCTTVYSESFIRDATDATSVHNLLAAGFTVSADQQCELDQINDQQSFVHTRTGVAFSVYQQINPDATWTRNATLTEQMMQYCRQKLGARCVLENNGITASSPMDPVYQTIKQMGPAISFQTATVAKCGNLDQTAHLAISLGANSVEVLPNLLNLIPDIATLNQQMAGNAARAPA